MIVDVAGQLDLLLSEPLSVAERRQRDYFADAAAPFTKIVLFGAGSLGRKLLARLLADKQEICCLSDNDQSKWGQRIEGIEVLPPSEAAKRFASSAAFVVSIWNYDHSYAITRTQLRLLGCQRILPPHPLMCALGGDVLPHYSLDQPSKIIAAADDVRRGFDRWADDESKAAYVATVRARLEMNSEYLPPPRDHYPVDLYKPSADDVFVDCGAYDGDTIADFLRRRTGTFQRIVGIEPDADNFRRLEASIGDLPRDIRAKVTLVNAAAAEKRGTASFLSTGTMAAALADFSTIGPRPTVEVQCLPLDEIVTGLTPTFVKVDVEGAELSVLKGAQSQISRAQTIWAVTTEHVFDDLWKIPFYFQSVSGDYDLFLRSHGYEALDLVCYAVPKGRADTSAMGLSAS